MGTSQFPASLGTRPVLPPFALHNALARPRSIDRGVALADVRLRGSAVAPFNDFVQSTFGKAGWTSFLAGLDAESRGVLQQPLIATNWYPFSACRAYIDGLMMLADRRRSVLRDFAIFNLDYATNVVFRAIFKVGTPEFMVARSDQVWKKFYSHGRMVCDVRPGHARIELHDFPFLSVNYGRVITHSIEAVLLKAGANVRRAEQTQTTLAGDRFSEFVYSWV